MITPVSATVILICLAVFLIVIVPILDGTEKFGKYISLRYTLTAMVTLMALGCILDFSHLAEEARNTVFIGAFSIIGLFVIARSLEKLMMGDRHIKLKLKKGDASAEAEVNDAKRGGEGIY